MTTTKKIKKEAQLVQEIKNIAAKTCSSFIAGYSRQLFYEIALQLKTYGRRGPDYRLPGARGPHPNRFSPDLEQAILARCLEDPTQGRAWPNSWPCKAFRSSGVLRGVWSRASSADQT